jgi:hypothetical protein
MQPQKVYYKKLFNLGNYSHEEIGVEIELDEGESVQSVIQVARKFVSLNSQETAERIKECEQVVKNQEEYTGRQVKAAQNFLKEIDEMQNSIGYFARLSEHRGGA